MTDKNLQLLVAQTIDRDKWRDILNRFVDVLKINVFLVDFDGQVIIPPVKDRYGWSFFEKNCLKNDAVTGEKNLLSNFVSSENYLEYRCPSGLQAAAVPINVEAKAIGYLIVGPTILNRKEDTAHYQQAAEKLKIDPKELVDTAAEARVVSHLTLKSILDLLSEVARDVVELNLEKKRLAQMRINQEGLSKKVTDAAQDIYATIHFDELLITLLDIALKMTNMECGSIMILDETNQLSVRASRGLEEKAQTRRLKIGEGVAGIALKDNESFVIHGTKGESRIQPFLRRPEIKHSIIMPILSPKKEACGVLNLHTKSDQSRIDENIDNLQYLSRLISAAFQSI